MNNLGPESGFVEANGLRLHYLAWGPEDARPMVLNHATGFLGRLWQPIAERLVEAGFRVYAYDARGQGDSQKPAPEGENYHWLRFAEDLRGFLDALGLRGVPFAGHSAGATAGLYLEATHPGYLSRMAAFEPIVMPGGFQPDEAQRDRMAEGARRRRMVFASHEEMVEQYKQRPTFELWPEEMVRLYAEAGTFQREDGLIELKCPGEIEGEIFSNSGILNVWDVLPDIGVPVLVMKGERTEGFLSMVADGVASRIPGGRVETIEGAGHLAPMERPDTVADEILRFVAGE